jgi:predicted aminopeptidase
MPAIMGKEISGRSLRVMMAFFILLFFLPMEACYYMQAARGQLDVLNRRRPVDEVIRDADSPDALRERLLVVQEAREFSINALRLPDNDSYRTYADLERDYVVWNVFAAPEFSLQAKTWCYPVAGCVGYRGYFSKENAERQGEKLRRAGFDVIVGGVSAYSTLGRFSDPVLNTMMRWSDLELIAVLFHELAHQQLYVKNDSEFNESFASAVEEVGIERWLASRGEIDRLQEYSSDREFRRQLMRLVQAARAELAALYASQIDREHMRERKRIILSSLREAAGSEVTRSARAAPGWLRSPLNNATLVPLSLYQGRLDEFRNLLSACDGDLPCFYKRAEALARQHRQSSPVS